MTRLRIGALALAVLVTVPACSMDDISTLVQRPAANTRTVLPADPTSVVSGASAAELGLATSKALFRNSPAVVLVAEDATADLPKAAEKAVQLGVPVLLTPAAAPGADVQAELNLRAELTRLAPEWIVTIGDGAANWARTSPPSPNGDKSPSVVDGVNNPAGLAEIKPAEPLSKLMVLAKDKDANSQAAQATARATGARVMTLAVSDPRADSKVVQEFAKAAPEKVLAIGADFGPPEKLASRINTAKTGVEIPGGGQLPFPGRRMIALYGHPGDPNLGVLGEQDLPASIERAKSVAATYSQVSNDPLVIPAFEIIVTVANGKNGSNEYPVELFKPWIEGARQAGVYVLLDLQPGLKDFPTQAKQYAELLKQPNVGLALDPEWRMKPGQQHMVNIGSVDASEINDTAAWLAQFVRENNLPPKVLMLHQFRLDMIKNRSQVDTSHDELQVVIHADGFGTPGQKFDTWGFMQKDPPPGIFWGWKNFYDEDQPTFTPTQTINIKPSPMFISYQ